MKNMYTLICLAAIIFFQQNIFAQVTIPNGNMETWSNVTGVTGAQKPDNWSSSNMILLGFYPLNNVFKETTGAYEGSFCARLENVLATTYTLPGVLSLGNIIVNPLAQTVNFTGGIPCAERPVGVRGYYKFTPVGADSFYVMINVTRQNGGAKDTIGSAIFTSNVAVSAWTLFEVPIQYDTILTGNPDTFNIVIASSGYPNLTAGTKLWVDSITMVQQQVNVPLIFSGNEPSFYPNPADNFININFGPETRSEASIIVYNLLGEKVISTVNNAGNENTVINLSDLLKGIYVIEVSCGNETLHQKIVVE